MAAEFRKILVAVRDVERAPRIALRKAAALAQAAGADVELFHAITEPLSIEAARRDPSSAAEEQAREIADRAMHRLRRMAELPIFAGLRVRVHAAWDYPPHEAIVRRAMRTRASLVVAETRTHRTGARLFLTNTDWELIRGCPCRLLLVRSTGSYDRPAVVAAVDPFHTHDKPASLDERLLETADTVSRLLRGELHLFHAYVPLAAVIPAPLVQPVPAWVPPETETAHLRRAKAALDRLAMAPRIPTARRHLRMGDVPSQLADVVRRTRARIVVMGAVSRKGLKRIFIGNTAERVLDEVGCDVLIVKPRAFRSAVPAEPAPMVGPTPA